MHSERQASELTADCRASKILLDNLAFLPNDKGMLGYIQAIHQDPFGLALFSHIQVLSLKNFNQRSINKFCFLSI